MAGTSWPALTAGAKAKASEVELKFDWIEGDVVPMSGGTKTDDTYDLGESSFRWANGYINRVLASSGTAANPNFRNQDFADGMFFPAQNRIAWAIGGSEVMRLDNNEDLGLGRVPSGYRLDIQDDDPTIGSSIRVTNDINTFTSAGTEYRTLVDSNGDRNFQIHHAGVGFISAVSSVGTATLQGRINGYDAATNPSITWDINGFVDHPSNSKFLSSKDSVQTINATTTGFQNIDVNFSNSVFDTGGDFNTSTAVTFLAPVTGKYLLSFKLTFANLSRIFNTITVNISTSNSNHQAHFNPSDIVGSLTSATNFPFAYSVIADMDSGDTAKINLTASQADTNTSSFDITSGNRESFFCGALYA